MFCLYGMEYGRNFLYGMEDVMEKNCRMEYGKIVFHSIPLHALPATPPG